MTIAFSCLTLFQEIRTRLNPVCLTEKQADAETSWLLEKLFQISAEQIYGDTSRTFTESEKAMLEDFLFQRIEKRVPLQYLLHEAYFYGKQWYVNPYVLIPRPETELLVETALQHIQPGMTILDVGTGSGVIAITLALQLEEKMKGQCQVSAVDASKPALQVARLNQKMAGTQVQFLPAGDLFAPIGSLRFDMIVSNPPYIAHELKNTLAPEVLYQEPSQALFPPETEDAYYFYHRLAREGKAHLKPKGHLIVECGAEMGPDIRQILMGQGFTAIRVIKDYSDQDRVVLGQCPG